MSSRMRMWLRTSGSFITCLELTARPMMVFSASPFLGPVLGPLIAGFINQNANWHWTFYVVIIWAAVMLSLILVFVPETFDPQLLKVKAAK
jgi:MFS family permease